VATYRLEFYEDERGDAPVRRWLREELTLPKRQALGYAMQIVLQRLGVAVCGTEFGRQLGGGLFEFRLRSDLRDRVPPGEKAVASCSGSSATLTATGSSFCSQPTTRAKTLRRGGRPRRSRSRGRGSGTGSCAERERGAVDV